MNSYLTVDKCGIYCIPGDFHVDPWKPVKTALITHGHSDHACRGSSLYVCTPETKKIICRRLGNDIKVQEEAYSKQIDINGVKVSFHPAGHILGSAQIRIEYKGHVTVASGDYKLHPDPTCLPFEPVKCNHFITESTFGLPIYKWHPSMITSNEINSWWKKNAHEDKVSVIYGYPLGKSQRILSGLNESIGPVFLHGAVSALTDIYRECRVKLPAAKLAVNIKDKNEFKNGIVIAPPSANGTPWLRKFGNISTAFVSGWMMIRGARRRRAVDRGFVMSDHADWDDLLTAIKETHAEKVFVTHGYTSVFSRYLNETGIEAEVLNTRYEGELGAEE